MTPIPRPPGVHLADRLIWLIPIAGVGAGILAGMHSGWYPVAGVAFAAGLLWFAWVTAYRRAVAAMPPAIAPLVLTGRHDGLFVYRMRVKLGHGRRISSGIARVVWRDGDVEIPLEVLVPKVKNIVGPWTIVARDREVRTGGVLVLSAELKEGRGLHPISQVFPLSDARPGRFGGLVLDGRLRWDQAEFAGIIPDPLPLADPEPP
jgi:hypothetical protein